MAYIDAEFELATRGFARAAYRAGYTLEHQRSLCPHCRRHGTPNLLQKKKYLHGIHLRHRNVYPYTHNTIKSFNLLEPEPSNDLFLLPLLRRCHLRRSRRCHLRRSFPWCSGVPIPVQTRKHFLPRAAAPSMNNASRSQIILSRFVHKYNCSKKLKNPMPLGGSLR